MKSAYELAMERLEKTAPTAKVNDAQRTEIAEIETIYRAKIAEREVFLGEQKQKALQSGDFTGVEEIEQQLQRELRRLNEESEAKKDAVRSR